MKIFMKTMILVCLYLLIICVSTAYIDTLEPTQCLICIENVENFDNAFLTRCGHWFHWKSCFEIYFKSDRRCPLCRTPISFDRTAEVRLFYKKKENNPSELKKWSISDRNTFTRYILATPDYFDELKDVLNFLSQIDSMNGTNMTLGFSIFDYWPFSIFSSPRISPVWIVNGRNEKGLSLLHDSAIYTNFDAIFALLDLGADIEMKTPDGKTAFDLAMLSKDDVTALVFMDKGCVITKREYIFWTVRNNMFYSLKKMLLKGSDPNMIESATGLNAVQLATISSDPECLLVILAYSTFDLKARTKNGKSLIHLAVENNNPSILRFLLVPERRSFRKEFEVSNVYLEKIRKVNVNTFDDEGQTPLMIACKKGNIDAVKLLIEFGAEADISSYAHLSPLEYTICHLEDDSPIFPILLRSNPALSYNHIRLAREKGKERFLRLMEEQFI